MKECELCIPSYTVRLTHVHERKRRVYDRVGWKAHERSSTES